MVFDVLKVVRSPGCDHGHDEESRNGRDMKIDILEAYVWMSEMFQVKSGFYRSTGRLPESPGGLWAYMGLSGNRGQQGGVGHPLPRPKPNWFRARGAAPLFPSPPLPFLPLS